jgi:site-specific DNA recombinase
MKRRILEIVFLNCRLEDATLCPVIRKPFDVLVKGLLVPQSGGAGN